MLVLGRKLNQTILIGQDIVVTVLGLEGNEVKLGIEAPHNVAILRQEIVQDVTKENRRAAHVSSPAALRRLAALARPETRLPEAHVTHTAASSAGGTNG